MSGNGKRGPKRTALGPEKIVEKEVLAKSQDIGISIHVIDSKAIYSKTKDRYTKNYCVPEGSPDLWGNDSNGFAVFLELKAPGKLKTLSALQRKFLEEKIRQGCFALCLDSADSLERNYFRWLQADGISKVQLLLELLP